MQNIIMKNFNCSDKEVRGWRSRRNTTIIIQSRVGSIGLNEDFSVRQRRDRCEADRNMAEILLALDLADGWQRYCMCVASLFLTARK